MSINQIQFQKGLSILDYIDNFGTDEQCFNALFNLRWPNGFICPGCGCTKFCQLTNRKLSQCINAVNKPQSRQVRYLVVQNSH